MYYFCYRIRCLIKSNIKTIIILCVACDLYLNTNMKFYYNLLYHWYWISACGIVIANIYVKYLRVLLLVYIFELQPTAKEPAKKVWKTWDAAITLWRTCSGKDNGRQGVLRISRLSYRNDLHLRYNTSLHTKSYRRITHYVDDMLSDQRKLRDLTFNSLASHSPYIYEEKCGSVKYVLDMLWM